MAPATTAYPPPISFIYPDRGNFIAFAFAGDVDARALVRESISLLREGGGNGQVLARSAGAMLLAPGQVLSDRPLRDLQVGDGGEDSLAPGKGAHEHQQGRTRKMKIGDERVHNFEVVRRVNENASSC